MKPKKSLALVLSLAMIISTLPTFSLTATAETTETTTTTEKNITLGTSALKGGQQSNVYFGTYQQSNAGGTQPEGTENVDWIKSDTATKNGKGPYYKKDPIKWRVLSNADGKAFLLSDKNLDAFRYFADSKGDYKRTNWGASKIRSWLNGITTEDFYGSAFGAAEKGAIADTAVVNANNPTHGTAGGNNTTDKVFLLSIAEAQNTAYGFNDDTTRIAVNTAYVRGGGKNGTTGMAVVGGASWWWLRSPGSSSYNAALVKNSGVVYIEGTRVNAHDIAVRPAFNLNLSSVLFTSAAVNGKPETFGEVAAYRGNEYKLTIKDSSRSSFTANALLLSENQLTFSYANAKTGANEYISAIIKDENGDVEYYGRLAAVTAENGNATVALPDDFDVTNDTLYIFNEQYNGDYKTDYASDFVNVGFTVSYNANGGSGTMESETSKMGIYSLPECSFTAPEGKTFYGWSESADGEIVKNTYEVTKDITLYAIWGDITEVKYTTDNGDSWNFDSLINAIYEMYMSPSGEIKLFKDITLTSSNWSEGLVLAYTNGNVIIDGQGYKITRGSGISKLASVNTQGSTVTLKNITVDGGAVWSDNNPATRTNSGLSFSGNAHLFDVDGASLILEKDTVLCNSDIGSYIDGAAISIKNGGTVTMNDGAAIKDCKSDSGAAVYVFANSTFKMNGGTITGCYAGTSGGAIYLYGGSATMYGGEISGNASGNNSGAVCIGNNGTFTLNDGVIKNNASTAGGGAVSSFGTNATLDVKGGEISSNTITGTLGGGILVYNGSLKLSGSPVIKDNTAKGNANNVYLNSSKVINIDGELSNTEKIGVTVTAPSVFTSGWDTYMNGKSESDYFASDKSVGYIALSGIEVAIKENVSFAVTDTEQIYTGEAKNITVTLHSENTLKVDDFTVKYYKINENEGKLESTTAVTNAVSAGKYLYVIDFADSSNKDGYTIVNALDKELDTTSAVSDFSSYGNTGIFTIKTGITGQQTPIYFKDGTVNLKVGGEFTNELTNENGTTPTFTSSNTDVATVDASGKVTAVGKGTATITAKSEKDETTPVYASYTVNVGLATITLKAEHFIVTAQDKVYDKTNEVKISAVLKDGVAYEGDNIKVDITGNFADATAGNNKKVAYTITGISGTGAENYVLAGGKIEVAAADSEVTANITKATVTIICATTTTRTFDGSTQTVDVSAMANGAVFDSSNYTVLYNGVAATDEEGKEYPSAVGNYPISIQLKDEYEKNYTVAQPNAKLIIKEATQEVFSIEGVPETVYYGDGFTVSTYGTDGTVTYKLTEGGEIAAINETSGAVVISGVGRITIEAKSTKDGYNPRFATKTFEVKKRVLTPLAAATGRPYNGENGVEVAISFGAYEIINNNDVSAKGIGTMVNADVGTDKIVYVSGITLYGEHKDLYTLSTTSVQTTVDITPIEIEGFTIEADSRKYDGTTTAQATVKEIKGILDGDKGQVGIVGSAVFEDENVAYDDDKNVTDKAVTFAATGLSGAKAANYTFKDDNAKIATATASIEPLSVDFIIGTKSFVYDGADKKITVSASDENGKIFKGYTVKYYAVKEVDGETEKTSLGDGKYPTEAGTYEAEISLNSTNYTTEQGTVDVTIEKATQDNLVIVGLPGTIQYGAEFDLEAVGGEEGGTYKWTVTDKNQHVTLSATDTATTTVTIGDVVGQKVEIVVTKSTENYDDISAKVVFVPTQKAVTFDISKLEQTYGKVEPVEVKAFDGSKEIELTEDEDYTITYNGGALPENAGTYTVKVEATGNYTGTQTATLTIKKATATGKLEMSANSYTYGSTDDISSKVTLYNGLDLDDFVVDIKYAGTGIYVAESEAPTTVGNYTAIATLTRDNYETLTLTADFKIEKATLKVWATSTDRPYGEANPIFTIEYDGFVTINGVKETKDVLLSEPIATVEANASSKVGKYNITVSGGSAENYQFEYLNDDKDDLGVLTITSVDGTLYITGSTHTAYVNDVFTLHAFIGNSKVNVTWGLDESSDADVVTIDSNGTVTAKKSGTVTITAIAGSNYNNAKATFNLTVKQTGIILVPTGLVKTYTGDWQDISFAENDDFKAEIGKNVKVEYTLISDPSVKKPIQVGTYSVVYTITDESYTGGGNTTMYINKANIELKPKDIEKVYGDEPTFELVTENTLITAEELATLTSGTTFTSEGKDKTAVAGEYDITAVLGTAASDNLTYTISGTGKLTVKKAPLTVKVKDVSREYGAENPTLEVEYTGFKNEETADVLTGELVLAYDESITAESAVDIYEGKTTASGLSSDNYDIKFENGNVTITKIPVTASKGTARSSYLTIKLDKAIEGLTAENFTVKKGEEEITLTAVTASSDNKTYTLKGTFSTSVTYTVTTTIESDTHEITSEALSIKPSSGGSSGGGGGGGSSSITTTYTVTFETNGGNEIDSVKVTKNKTAAEPTEPTKDGYTFDGWYTDKELTKAYDFETKITKAITLYAKWTENEVDNTDDKTDETDDKTDIPVWENPFTDIKADDWYYENARYAVENGLFNGTTSTTFAPDGIITRAMMVTVLYRAEGEPEITGTATFGDVDSNAYYAKAVVWGQQNGIIKGYSESLFAPDQNITREQIAAIMFRYAQYKDVAPTGAWAIRLDYADLEEIADYATEGVMYCKLKGIMQGKGDNNFAPQDNATRAETAAILQRFIEANK